MGGRLHNAFESIGVIHWHLPDVGNVLRHILMSRQSGGISSIHVPTKTSTTLFLPIKRVVLQQRCWVQSTDYWTPNGDRHGNHNARSVWRLQAHNQSTLDWIWSEERWFRPILPASNSTATKAWGRDVIHMLRKENQMGDAFANLASSMALGEDKAANVPVCQRWVISLVAEMLLDDTKVISVL